jgi:allophanate hydrolase
MNSHNDDLPMTIEVLRTRYLEGSLTPAQLVERIAARPGADDPHRVWIRALTQDEMMRYAEALADRDPAALPLYGVPFAIKDNIDLAGVPTTAGCPAYAYTPERSAPVVERLIAAGAIPVGKTNLDQFATGLSGQRSPYGACRNALDPEYTSGGSSSGSAVAVALGLAAFSLGTDTAGSGRVPAAFNGLVGLKPTKGVLSTLGVVPACLPIAGLRLDLRAFGKRRAARVRVRPRRERGRSVRAHLAADGPPAQYAGGCALRRAARRATRVSWQRFVCRVI